MKNKKAIFFLMSVFSLFSLIGVSFARAEDDEDEVGDDDRYEQSTSSQSNKSEDSTPSEKTVTVKKTIIIEPARIVTENVLQDEVLPDSDKDGIPDIEDPHPSISEIYIVSDDNNNGIVDTFEYAR